MAEKDETNVEKIEYAPPDDTNIPHYYREMKASPFRAGMKI
jgi:hypothetical protein